MIALLDTNILVNNLNGQLAHPFPPGRFAVSVITEIELLGWPGISPAEESAARALLATMRRLGLTAPIKSRSIALRRATRLKLPDAIICATALTLDVELWTNDATLFRVPGLRTRAFPMVAPP